MKAIKKVKGTVLVRNIQGNHWGVLKTRIDKKNVTLRFLSSGLDRNINNGSAVSGIIITQHCDGLNLEMVVNIHKAKGVKAKNVRMLKSSGRKKGHVTSVNPVTQSRIINSNGTNYIDFGPSWYPVGTKVSFKDSGVVDPVSGLNIAVDVMPD